MATAQLRIIAWPGQAAAYVRDVLNWTRPAESMAWVCATVCFTTLDAVAARPLLLLPLGLHAFLLAAYGRRVNGAFLSSFIKRGGASASSASANSSLKVAEVAAKGLWVAHAVPRPMVCLALARPGLPDVVRCALRRARMAGLTQASGSGRRRP